MLPRQHELLLHLARFGGIFLGPDLHGDPTLGPSKTGLLLQVSLFDLVICRRKEQEKREGGREGKGERQRR